MELAQKEYFMFKKEINKLGELKKNYEIKVDNVLNFTSYQLFCANYMNPNTIYSRLLMKWSTGSGKTIGSLAIAKNFVEIYHNLNDAREPNIGSVFIIGFTENIFRSELLSFPEFGFITREEINIRKTLEQQASTGSESSMNRLAELKIKLNRRLTNRKGNAFFQFMGYKYLANRLFITSPGVNISDLERDDIIQKINSGEIKINQDLAASFANSLIICDEIHELYNSVEKNNWGTAIEIAINYSKSTRAVFLSATPLNNNPAEIVDLLNLLLPKHEYQNIKRSDLFDNDNHLLRGAEDTIAALLKGRVSFIRDINPIFYPGQQFAGEKIKGIDYLQFVRCPMSQFHYKTYKNNYHGTLSIEDQYLLDFAIPDPEFKDPYDHDGLFRTSTIKQKLGSASDQWKKKFKLDYSEELIAGDALHRDADLKNISSKYHSMVKNIFISLKNGGGKKFIYHNIIHMSGVLFAQEVLRANGFIDEFDAPDNSTICVICAKKYEEHKVVGGEPSDKVVFVTDSEDANFGDRLPPKYLVEISHGRYDKALHPWPLIESREGFVYLGNVSDIDAAIEEYDNEQIKLLEKRISGGDHIFRPARFVVIHSNIEKKILNRSLEKFSAANNTEGLNFYILIGGKIIKQSYTIMAVEDIYVMSRPDNISTLLQILGRVIRNGSHALLPPERRKVTKWLFTSCLPGGGLSHEEEKYREKIESYKIIETIDKIMHEVAIDAQVNYEIIQRSSGITYPDILPYDVKKINVKDISYASFNAHHQKKEFETITYVIKRLFLEYFPAWKYSDLFKHVKEPPFSVSVNMNIISKHIFNVALTSLIYIKEDYLSGVNELYHNMADKIYKTEEKLLRNAEGDTCVIIHRGDLYILLPFNTKNQEVHYTFDAPFRIMPKTTQRNIDITTFLKKDLHNNYDIKKNAFINKWKNIDVQNYKIALCEYGTRFHQNLIEDAIEYVFTWWLEGGKRDENHIFYFKILQYYDLHKFIIWMDMLKKNALSKYGSYMKKIIMPKNGDTKESIYNEKIRIKELKLTLTQSDPLWISTGMINSFNERLDASNKIDKKGPIPAEFIPVGHFIDIIPRFYSVSEGGWVNDPLYINPDVNYVENDTIIGYESKSKSGINLRFKLRAPIHNIEIYKDARLIQRGAICSTKQKSELEKIASMLKIKPAKNVQDICTQIKDRLIYLELKERERGSNIKWYYTIYEKMPDIEG